MNVHEKFAAFFKNENLKPFAYLVSKKLSQGHICIHKEGNYEVDFEDSIYEFGKLNWTNLKCNDLVTLKYDDKKPFIFINNKLYLYRYFNYETEIENKLRKLINEEKSELENRRRKLVSELEFIKKLQVNQKGYDSLVNIEKIDWQLIACLNSFLHNFSIITGGPGTGKTTTVAKLLALLYKANPDFKMALAAPTGKAGMRIQESLKNTFDDELNTAWTEELTGLKHKIYNSSPFTIHRLLGFKRNSPYFKHNETNNLKYDVIIIDEASMIDVPMFAKVLNAVKPEARIILLGDKEQLASVEAGSLLGDLCETLKSLNMFENETKLFFNKFLTENTKLTSLQVIDNPDLLLFNHIVELKRSYRSQDHPEINMLSKAIINSSQNEIVQFYKNFGEARIVFNDCDDKLFKEFVSHFEKYILETDVKKALEILNSSKILCGVKNGPKGVYAMNKKIEHYLKGEKLNPNKLFYDNRPIIVTKNYKELELFNGDTGIVRNGVAYFLDINNELRKVIPELITECETVFAMSIHKSQGSEYKNVLVMLPDNMDNNVLTKELLYTAITRAKERVVLLAKQEVIESTINKSVSRASGIKDRLN